MPSRRLIVLTAIELEARALRAALPADVSVQPIGIAGSRLAAAKNLAKSTLIIAGLGGALDPTLHIGDVVLDDPQQLVPAAMSIRRGKIHTADQIVSTVAEKSALFAATGAVAVDMEQAIVQRLAESQGVAWLGVRAVSDTAAEALDPAFVKFVDDLGRPRPAAIAMGLLRRPALAGQLTRLERNSKIALERLGEAVREIALIVQQK